MVNKQIILQTVKRMVDSGIEDEQIKLTLQGFGLSDEEIDDLIASAQGKSGLVSEPEHEPEEDFLHPHEEIAAKTAEHLKEHLNEAREEQELRDTMTHNILDSQTEKIHDVGQRVNELHEKVDRFPSAVQPVSSTVSGNLGERLIQFEKDLGEIKASANALQTILKKILDTNREILMKLSTKK